jgi:gliding motility-associated-like protein
MRFVFALLFLIPASLMAQVPIVQWQRTYGGSGDDRLVSIQQTNDGGYILGGHSKSGVSGDKTEANRGEFDYWIMKVDASGLMQWQKTYGGQHNDYLATIFQTSDGGYFAAGYSESGATGDKTAPNKGTVGSAAVGRDYWLLKLDANGNISWQKTYGGMDGDMAFAAVELKGGGFMVNGLSASATGDRNSIQAPSYGYNDHWMVRLDANGNILWQRSNGGSLHDAVFGMAEVPGGWVMGGYSCSGPSGTKTTPFYGNGGPSNSTANRDNWVVRTDTAGVIRWQQEVAGSGYDSQIGNTIESGDFGISLTTHGEILVGTRSTSPISGNKTVAGKGGYDYWLAALDSNTGAFNWQWDLGGTGNDYLGAVFQTSDHGYFISGHSESGIGGDKTDASRGSNDFWVLKADASRNVQWQKTIGGSGDDQLMSALQTSDGWFLLAGFSNSNISGEKDEASRGDYDWWLVKLGPCDTTPTRIVATICVGDEYLLPNGGVATNPGIYYDTLRNVWNTCDSVVITTIQYFAGDNVHLLEGNMLGNDTAFCADQQLLLQVSYPNASYAWSTGETNSSIQVNASGDYAVKVTSPNGCVAHDTIQVIVFPMPVVDLGADTGICDAHLPFVLKPYPETAGSYRWSNGLTSKSIDVYYSGRYILEIEANGCLARDTINVIVVPTPSVFIGNDSVICEQFPLRIGTEIREASYLWNTGAVQSYIEVSQTGQYILDVNLHGCHVQDSVDIIAMPVPEIDLGEDRDICPDEIVLLDASYGNGSRYRWNTGDTTAAYAASAAGWYQVEVVTEYGCVGEDEITLSYHPKPVVSLGADTVVCEETALRLHAWSINADSIRWSDGTNGTTLETRFGGEYIAMAFNKCGSGSDTVLIRQIFCDIWLPNAFTPNADGVNDVFRVLGNIARMEGTVLSIFNRWGEQVYLTRDKYKGWDGFHKGVPAQSGTYVYLLQYSIDGKPYSLSGNFHLLR